MNVKSVVKCPDCKGDIFVDSVLLLAGSKFACSNPDCSVAISLDASDAPVVEDAYQKYEALKNNAMQGGA